MLQAKLRKRLRHFELNVDLACGRGETLCVVGPSGSGKTTLLRFLAGLENPDEGVIRMGGDVWWDSRARIRRPPQRRSAGLVFQDYSLFPHMSLWRNVAYAAPGPEIVDRLLKIFGIAHLKDMSPADISGGERQRGALCQALARGPQLLLLDEPFSALDIETRLGLRRVLQRVQQETPLCMVHVTHDLTEALFLGDRVVALRQGRLAPDWLDRQIELLRREQTLIFSSNPGQAGAPAPQEERSCSYA